MEVRSLVSNSIYAKKDRNGTPSANQLLLRMSPDVAMLFALFGYTNPPPPVPPFLLTQNLSPKDIAGSDIMKLKVSQRIYPLCGLNCLETCSIH